MRIRRHRLHLEDGPAPFVRSPNVGGTLAPRYLIVHYTGAGSAEGSVDWLTRAEARASAHLVIARDGRITQLVPFNRVAWHAGASAWEGLRGLNHHAIGIELDNAGRLEEQGRQWRAWFGATYPSDQVMVATHKHEEAPAGWHIYTPEQIDATLRVARALVAKYALRGVAGHDDIAPGRKSDPGPAFPLGALRGRVSGRAEDTPPRYTTTTHLNIRSAPGTAHPRLEASPLAPETPVEVLAENGEWRRVVILDDAAPADEREGWVHGRYLTPKEE